MKRLLAICAIIIVISSVHFRDAYSSKTDPSLAALAVTEDVLSLYPDASVIDPIDTPGVYSIYGPREDLLGYLIDSRGHSDHIKGWGGATPVLIAVSPENEVTGIHLLPNNESGYVRPIIISSNLLKAWNGIQPEEANAVKVDAVTAATITSRAIEKTIKHRLSKIAGILHQFRSPESGIKEIVPEIIIVILALIFCFLPIKRKAFVRRPFQIILIVYLGFMKGYLLSIALFASWINDPRIIRYSIPLVILAIPAILVPFFTGRNIYCGYICPFGALQELLSRIPLSKKIRVPRKAKIAKYILLLASAVIIIGGFAFDLTNIEPFTAFLLGYAKIAPIVIAVVFLILSIFIVRPWCLYFCPTGCLVESLRRKRSS